MAQDDLETREGSLGLLRRAQAGDRGAYERLFARYYPRVLAIARARLGARLRERAESQDLVQEAMVQAVRSLERFEPRSDARLIGWFAKIVENRIRDEGRRADARAEEVAAVVGHLASSIDEGRLRVDPESPDSQPIAQLIRSERAERLQRCLARLDESQRELIVQRTLQGSSWSDVADELDYPSPDAARMAYGRARVALGRLFAADADS